jgi:hypothetical protein
MTQSELWKRALTGGAGAAAAAALLTLLIDPTAHTRTRLDDLKTAGLPEVASRRASIDPAGLSGAPIFVMTSGPSAYKERSVQVFGISISPKRKAALVGVDGAAPVWMTAGESAGDLRLSDVGTNGVSFDTPVGPRTVTLSDAPSGQNPAAQTPVNKTFTGG